MEPFSIGFVIGNVFGSVGALILRPLVMRTARELAAKIAPPVVLAPMKPNTTTVEDLAAAVEKQLDGRFRAIDYRITQMGKAADDPAASQPWAPRPIETQRTEPPKGSGVPQAKYGFGSSSEPVKTWRDNPDMVLVARDVAQALVTMGISKPAASKLTVAAVEVHGPGARFEDVFKTALKGGAKK